MYKSIFAAVCSLSLMSFALAGESAQFDLEIQDGTLSDAVQLVNGFCESEMGKLEVDNPDERLSLEMEGVSCEQAVELLKEYDSGKA